MRPGRHASAVARAEQLRARLRAPKESEDVINLELGGGDDPTPRALRRLTELTPTGVALAAVWGAFLVVMAVWYRFHPGWMPMAWHWHGEKHFAEIAFVAPWIAATVACFLAARAAEGRRRWAWGLLGMGTLLWVGGGELYDYFHWLLTHKPVPPPPSPVDIGYLGATGFWFAGIWLLARGGRGVVTEFRSVVDTLIGVTAIGIVIWTLVVQNGLDNYHYLNMDSTKAMLTNFAYPLFDFGLLSALIFGMTVRRMRGDLIRWLLVAALAGITLSDLVYFREFFLHGDAAGFGNLQDFGWTFGAATMALAAGWHRWGIDEDTAQAEGEVSESKLAPPFVFLSVTLGVLVAQSLHGGVRTPAVVGVVVVAMLMMLRLHLSFKENRALLLTAQYQALTDALTGLASRRYFEQRLAEEVSRARRGEQRTAVIMIDVDHFKEVNDGFGHDVGDSYLVEIARQMRSACRGSDVPCRIGGDEFAIIAPGADVEGAMILAERVREGVAEAAKVLLKGRLNGTISAGICTMPDSAETMEELLKLADNALYRAKVTRNAIVAHEPEAKPESQPEPAEPTT